MSITNFRSLLKLMSIESVMPSNRLILYRPLLLLPSVFPSIRVFSNESVLRIWWPKYWSFSFSIRPSNGYSELISFRMDWLDLLAVPGTLKSLLQHPSLKASILWHSAFFIVQLSHPLEKAMQPTPVLLTGKSDGWRSLVGCSPWGRKELDTTEQLHFHISLSCIGEGNGNPGEHSSVLAWRIPGMAESGGLPSMGSHRVRHN